MKNICKNTQILLWEDDYDIAGVNNAQDAFENIRESILLYGDSLKQDILNISNLGKQFETSDNELAKELLENF